MCHLMREPDDRLADADVLAEQIVSKHLCANTQIHFCHKYLNTLAGERGQQKASFEYFAKSRSYLNISGQKHFGIILKFNSQILQSCHSMNIPWNFQTESIFLPFEVRFRQRGEWRHHLTPLPPTSAHQCPHPHPPYNQNHYQQQFAATPLQHNNSRLKW